MKGSVHISPELIKVPSFTTESPLGCGQHKGFALLHPTAPLLTSAPPTVVIHANNCNANMDWERKELVSYTSSGKPVCHDHGLRVCGICCVDFDFQGLDDDDEISDEDSRPQYSDDDDRVFTLVGSTARFIPQGDEEVLGPANVIGFSTTKNALLKPDPPSALSFFYCPKCQVTWLQGEAGKAPAQKHPSHHTLSHIYAGTRRSLAVFVDGACSSNGLPAANAGIGIYFGPDSRYNISEAILGPGTHTNQRAELFAVLRALQEVKSQVMPARQKMLQLEAGKHDKTSIRDVAHLRLIVATDSSYVVEAMCENYPKWKLDDKSGHYKNKRGDIIKNSDVFEKLLEGVDQLSRIGVQVVYYHVGREHNVMADALAKKSLQ